jgi:hypothetical protein
MLGLVLELTASSPKGWVSLGKILFGRFDQDFIRDICFAIKIVASSCISSNSYAKAKKSSHSKIYSSFEKRME